MSRGFTTLDLFFPPRVWPRDPWREREKEKETERQRDRETERERGGRERERDFFSVT